MITCKTINIQPCPSCDNISVGECWLIYWKNTLPNSIDAALEQYMSLPITLDYDYKFYFLNAAKLYHIELYNQLSKLSILE